MVSRVMFVRITPELCPGASIDMHSQRKVCPAAQIYNIWVLTISLEIKVAFKLGMLDNFRIIEFLD